MSRPAAWILDHLQAPAVPVSTRDRITFTGIYYGITATIYIGARVLTRDGELVDIQAEHSISSSASLTIPAMPLPDGWLVAISINTGNFQIPPGQLWIEMAVSYASAAAGRQWLHLVHGYIGTHQSLSWPQVPQNPLGWGPGITTYATASNPAAGADWAYTHAGNRRGDLLCITAKLVTDANVATRYAELYINEPSGGQIYYCQDISGTPASTTQYYSWVVGATDTDATPSRGRVRPVPALILGEDHEIGVSTTSIQAGDQWSDIYVSFIRHAGRAL